MQPVGMAISIQIVVVEISISSSTDIMMDVFEKEWIPQQQQ
jgi:hypothetical protein